MRMIDADALIDLINRAEIRYDINGDPLQETREQIFAHAWGMYKVIMEETIYNQPTPTPPNEPLPVLINDEPDREYIDYICPRCKNTISQCRRGQRMETVYQCKYHDNCGQRVDWNNSQPDRRPPEGEEDT